MLARVNSGALVHHLEVVGEALQGLFRLPESGGVVLLDAQIPQAADAALLFLRGGDREWRGVLVLQRRQHLR